MLRTFSVVSPALSRCFFVYLLSRPLSRSPFLGMGPLDCERPKGSFVCPFPRRNSSESSLMEATVHIHKERKACRNGEEVVFWLNEARVPALVLRAAARSCVRRVAFFTCSQLSHCVFVCVELAGLSHSGWKTQNQREYPKALPFASVVGVIVEGNRENQEKVRASVTSESSSKGLAKSKTTSKQRICETQKRGSMGGRRKKRKEEEEEKDSSRKGRTQPERKDI